MTRVSPPHSGVSPPTSRVGSGTSCRPRAKPLPPAPAHPGIKRGLEQTTAPGSAASPAAEPTFVRFPPLWGEGAGGRRSRGVQRRRALGAPHSHLAPSLLSRPSRAPSLPPGPHLHPGWGSCLPAQQPRLREDSSSLPSSGRRGHCGLGTEAARRAPEERQRPPLGKGTPFRRLGWTLRDPGAPCSAAPSLTTWSGPGTHRSSRAAQRSRSGGAERVGLQEGCRAHAAPRLPSP